MLIVPMYEGTGRLNWVVVMGRCGYDVLVMGHSGYNMMMMISGAQKLSLYEEVLRQVHYVKSEPQ